MSEEKLSFKEIFWLLLGAIAAIVIPIIVLKLVIMFWFDPFAPKAHRPTTNNSQEITSQ